MPTKTLRSVIVSIVFVLICFDGFAQDLLPPVIPFNGRSLELVSSKENQWITPVEKSSFEVTPTYAATMDWLKRLCASTKNMRMISIGRSAQGRDITMLIASNEKSLSKESLITSNKPLLLVQGGIHAGEIDGKDAGMMLMRDIAFGSKAKLLQGVNILFIPILNVDGHERSGQYNRVNQRGPSNQGWRTNAKNLNLNRDYSKLDTEEVTAVVSVIQSYDPDLYLDLHVTDGADYQYDITYGYSEDPSRAITTWFTKTLTPHVDNYLREWGHFPGRLVFSANESDFTDGMIEFPYSPRFSNGYGTVRHLPTILVENHSLKPFKQRVLGTYVFLEGVINVLSAHGMELKKAIEEDRKKRNSKVILTYEQNPKRDSVDFLGIRSERKKSAISDSEYVVWSGVPVSQVIPYIRNNVPAKMTSRPKAIYIPSTYPEVVKRLKAHGVITEPIASATEIDVSMFKINSFKFSQRPVEGHFTVTGSADAFKTKETFYPGTIKVSTDQPLGDLAIHLLHPDSPDSFLQWGFFSEIFSRTEYMERYVLEPMAERMLKQDEALKSEFEDKKKADPEFSRDPQQIYEWFYERSPYYDARWKVYPVGFEY